ncbi:hypothetical protein ACFC6U_16700 [Kitasatospora purpeofusca]|uniref:hypothetical protein n=1 Tax=Kitasatospora purpeofusca TaxID=67352 RepID=UPI0035DFC4F6
MPQITLPDDTPWWVVGLLAFLLVSAVAVGIVARATLPGQSGDRLTWWSRFWDHRVTMKTIKHEAPASVAERDESDFPPPPAR